MKDRATRYARPALWGFFICIAIACVLAVASYFIPSFVASRWDSERDAWNGRTAQLIREDFRNRIERLDRIAEMVSKDTLLYAFGDRDNVHAAPDAFHILNSYELNDDQTIDLIDSNGNVIAWNGLSISSDYSKMLGKNPSSNIVRVSQNGLKTYLSVGTSIGHGKLYLLTSELLELSSPLSNRFVQKVSISEDLSQKLHAKTTLQLPNTYEPHQGEIVIPIDDNEGNTIAEFLITERTLEGEISSILEIDRLMVSFFLSLGALLLACFGMLWIANKNKLWLKALSFIMLIWLVRIAWYNLNIPGDFIGGWLFNPTLYASPFAFGLASSLGDLIISVVAVMISIWIMLVKIVLNRRTENVFSKIGYRLKHIAAIVLYTGLAILVLWLFRGYGESIKSFVFDSTIQYNNPSEIFLSGTAAYMQFNILLLGAALLCISIILLWIARHILFVQYSSSEWKRRSILAAILSISIILFTVLDKTPLNIVLVELLLLIISITLVELIDRWNKANVELSLIKLRIVVWLVIGSFLIGAPVLHQYIKLKERREVEAKINEFMRPSDSWLTNVVLDGLHTSADELMGEFTKRQFRNIKEDNLAFVLWTKTLLGREGFNSALIIYDHKGNEIDRFVVGMSKQEQREILTRVFEGEEDAVHVLGQTVPKSFGKLYGAWVTIRDLNAQVLGSIAVLLSEHQRNIFNNEEDVEPLKQFGNRLENSEIREIAVHEYENDSLVFSTGRKLFPELSLFQIGPDETLRAGNNFIWKDISINGYETQTLFVRDISIPDRIIAVSLEKLDIRWDMFGYLKEFSIYIIFLAFIGVCLFFQRRVRGVKQAIGFRGKLFLGFACIVLLSLAILSYYNRRLVAERVQEQLEKTLYDQLIQLQDRISDYVSNEEDFIRGIDDDFCEALTSEYGIDFSIYRNASIQASSRSELYRANLLDKRLNGKSYTSAMQQGKGYIIINEKIGSIEYVVGYAPISINGQIVGVLAVPTLNRQKEIESEMAQRNAYVFGAYAIVFGIALAFGGLLTYRFTKPLNRLTYAAKNVSKGNLDVEVKVKSNDEIGLLVQSFNEMVAKLRVSRIELAKHERENAWKEMAKQVAHEIRNPLTPIKLSVQHLRQAFKDNAPDREEILQRVTRTIIDQIETLSQIATEFSNFAKMPDSKYEKLNVDELLKETINLFKEIKGIRFVDRLACPAVSIVADRNQLKGVFINIIRNAIQAFSGDGTISIETSVDEHVNVIRISDSGPGIPDEIQSKIFEPNFSTKTEGLGLGLAIARRVIEDHGGTISCSSQRSKGTTFEIRLPI